MSDDEQLDDLEIRVDALEDNILRVLLEELCLRGKGSDPITKEELYAVLTKPL